VVLALDPGPLADAGTAMHKQIIHQVENARSVLVIFFPKVRERALVGIAEGN
jgi:hypothetical protein